MNKVGCKGEPEVPTMTLLEQPLVGLVLPSAPPVTRSAESSLHRPRWPLLVLLVLGSLLVVGPLAGGLFAKMAAGTQMIDEFAPHMETGALTRYGTDLRVMRGAAAAVEAVYHQDGVADGRFPLLDTYRRQSAAIDDRASGLLGRVTATQSDYRQVAGIGGLDRIPFLVVLCGLIWGYGACILLLGRRASARAAVVIVLLASVAIAVYPFASNLYRDAGAGARMLHSLAPVMTTHEVRELQGDFVVLVEAVGELDTTFRPVASGSVAGIEIADLVNGWPRISSDLASLVGTINDNVGNFNALDSLDAITFGVGVSGFVAFPWVLVGIGTAGVALGVAALPRRRKEAA